MEDFGEFTKDDLKAIFKNIHNHVSQLDTSEPPTMQHIEPYLVSTNSQKHFIVAAHAVYYYKQIGRTLESFNMNWMTLKNFEI